MALIATQVAAQRSLVVDSAWSTPYTIFEDSTSSSTYGPIGEGIIKWTIKNKSEYNHDTGETWLIL